MTAFGALDRSSASAPVVIFALIVQRHIIRGLTLGGVTG